MKNVVGQTPRNDDFFPRDLIIQTIYRRLEAGNHLYLSAPRRAGKTSIMRALEDKPRAGYVFVYVNVEDCIDPEQYFRLLAEELEKSDANGKLAKLGDKAKPVFTAFLDRIKKIKFAGFELETTVPGAQKQSYAQAFEQLLQDLESDALTIVVMVDEFPVAVEGIAKAINNQAAVTFLHTNRGMRQRSGEGIRFIYTGSIGLPNVARKLDPMPTINDLNVVEIPPLTKEEGVAMSKLILQTYGLTMPDATIQHMLKEIDWLMPFFIQLVIQLVIDEHESSNTPISNSMVDTVIAKASNHRNNIYFASYYDRLAQALPEDECVIAKSILKEIADNGSSTLSKHLDNDAQHIIETLEYDGYIHEASGAYRFNSPILRKWWQKHARDRR
jgi:uncharacterized protein